MTDLTPNERTVQVAAEALWKYLPDDPQVPWSEGMARAVLRALTDDPMVVLLIEDDADHIGKPMTKLWGWWREWRDNG